MIFSVSQLSLSVSAAISAPRVFLVKICWRLGSFVVLLLCDPNSVKYLNLVTKFLCRHRHTDWLRLITHIKLKTCTNPSMNLSLCLQHSRNTATFSKNMGISTWFSFTLLYMEHIFREDCFSFLWENFHSKDTYFAYLLCESLWKDYSLQLHL